MSLEELFAGRLVDIPRMLARLKQAAADEGLAFGDRKYTFNSRKAQELGKWAKIRGKGDAFHLAVFRAYFAEGKNIARIPVLLEMAGNAGLDPEEARSVLEKRIYKEAVDADWLLSRQTDIRAVPAFVAGDRILSGAQPYSVLEKLIISQGAEKKTE